MRHKQIEGEIKYRFACLLLNQMLEDKFITKDELSHLEFNFKDGSVINIEL